MTRRGWVPRYAAPIPGYRDHAKRHGTFPAHKKTQEKGQDAHDSTS